MLGENCPAWLCVTGRGFSPSMPAENSEPKPGAKAEYMRKYNQTHKKSHHSEASHA
jgi:hypothetical protein